ncbi:MAG: hypothetical protein K8W52_38795 [Deltaproteobacteria bacterium]|nr:hypothetical protein [Deltaproteobacteria bacterium]
MRFEVASLPEAAPILAQPDLIGSTIVCWTVAAVAPMIALYDPAAVGAAADALVAAHAEDTRGIDRTLATRGPHAWVPITRSDARRALLHPLRYSLAYGGRDRLGDRATTSVDAFLARFGEDARFLTSLSGFVERLDADGRESLGGYGVDVILTGATFELVVVTIDWDRAGLLVATDED